MVLRTPQSFARQGVTTRVDTALNVEILEEKASALGRAGRRVEKAMDALQRSETSDRDEALEEASRAVYHLIIQREMCGLRNHRAFIESYSIPANVLARLGSDL